MEGDKERRAGGDKLAALPPNPRPWRTALASVLPSASAYGVTNSEGVMWSLISYGRSDQLAEGAATKFF